MGLRHPSEETFSMITTLLLICDQTRFYDAIGLRSAYLSTKTQARAVLAALKKAEVQPPLGLLQELPLDPKELDSGRKMQSFGDQEPAPLPPNIKMDTLHLLRSKSLCGPAMHRSVCSCLRKPLVRLSGMAMGMVFLALASLAFKRSNIQVQVCNWLYQRHLQILCLQALDPLICNQHDFCH